MLFYEHERTEDIVSRIIMLAKISRVLIILFFTLLLSGLGALSGGLLVFIVQNSSGEGVVGYDIVAGLFIGAAVGEIIGLYLGRIIASLVIVGYEWMAQMLISQGQIIAAKHTTR